MTEYEVKIIKINIEDARARLTKTGGMLHKPAHIIRNIALALPAGSEINGGWLRIREEDSCTAMSLKIIGGNHISDQKEYRFVVNDFDEAFQFLQLLGARQKAYQEKRREIWLLKDCEVVIDEWPFLEPLIEVEGPSEESVRHVVESLGYDYSKTLVCSTSTLYNQKYGVEENIVNNHTPQLIFNMENPFLGKYRYRF